MTVEQCRLCGASWDTERHTHETLERPVASGQRCITLTVGPVPREIATEVAVDIPEL